MRQRKSSPTDKPAVAKPVVAKPVAAKPVAAKPERGARMGAPASDQQAEKSGLHPRNRHQGHYDFARLVAGSPALSRFVTTNRFAIRTIDFADPAAVKALNQAILKTEYGVSEWDLPAQYLCPPIPGRADYLHHLADLLASVNGGTIPRGPKICAFDLGVGASAIYPLLGHREYGWRFTASDSDPTALASAQRIVRANPGLDALIILRRQRAPLRLFAGVVQEGERFDVALSNPPFHASAAEATAGTRRKWHNLGRPGDARRGAPLRNFGGQESEIWCPGGEVGFISRMISESAEMPGLCLWFTSLVSKESSLPEIIRALRAVHVRERRIIEMAQGQKRSRIIAWTFLDDRRRRDWRAARWG